MNYRKAEFPIGKRLSYNTLDFRGRFVYDGGTKNKEVPKMKMDNEKILRKQREKKAAIILAARRKEKAAARYAETRIDDTPKKYTKMCQMCLTNTQMCVKMRYNKMCQQYTT